MAERVCLDGGGDARTHVARAKSQDTAKREQRGEGEKLSLTDIAGWLISRSAERQRGALAGES